MCRDIQVLILLILYGTNHRTNAEPLMGHNIRNAIPNEVPFMTSLKFASLSFSNQPEKRHFCGGTLISRRHILTAAHCVPDLDKRTIVVTIGNTDINDGWRYLVDSAVTFNEWASDFCLEYDDYDNDIAIMKLSRCLDENVAIATITSRTNYELKGLEAVIAGWGRTDTATISTTLRVANMTVITNDECRDTMIVANNEPMDDVHERFLCTKSDPYTNVGCGDSGGPLLINENEIIGVVSSICPSLTDFPNVPHDGRINLFSSTFYYKEFINSILAGSSNGGGLGCSIM